MTAARILIAGGGFSGTAVAIELARMSSVPLEITVVEPREMPGGGVAYSTAEPAHRINVPADRMQLSGDEPGAFDRWYRQQPESVLDPAAHCADGSVYPQRGQFGRYLAQQFAAAASRFPQVKLQHRRARALSWEGQQLLLSDGDVLRGDVLVLAISHPPPSLPALLQPFSGHPALIANPWQPGVLDTLDPQARVGIIGTGLSMADVAAALERRQHRGPLLAFSRRGQRSRANLSGEWPAWTLAPCPAARARAWLRHTRAEIARAAAQGIPWQRVLDAVRAQGQQIWQALPLAEQQRFARHLRSWWDVHRYRVAPQVASAIAQRLAQGTLQVLAARMTDITPCGDQLALTLRLRSGALQTQLLDHMVVTTGPAHDTLLTREPLLSSLAQQGLIQGDALGFGIAVDAQSRALNQQGQASGHLLVAGPAARGRFGELMGLPQVADHAAAVARQILHTLNAAHDGRCRR